MKKKFNIVAVILAGGKGERMGGNFKQFLKINNKPVLFYSLEEFVKCNFLKEIVVVVHKEKLDYAVKIIFNKFKDRRIKVIAGGDTRRWSAYNALKFLSDKKIDYVIFHDASRPLISNKMIQEVVKEAINYDGAVVGVKAIDLIFDLKNKFISRAFNKDRMYYGFTPQCFKFDLIKKAHFKIKNSKYDSADNIELLKKFKKNIKIKLIDKFYPNFKLTYKPDIKVIKALLK